MSAGLRVEHPAVECVPGELPAAELTESRFPCTRCGAVLHFKAGSGSLVCRHCGHANAIIDRAVPIEEYPLEVALAELAQATLADSGTPDIICQSCGARFELGAYEHAGECPYCGTTVVLTTASRRPVRARALLPFRIDEAAASQAFRRWISGLWFAPGALKRDVREDGSLHGVYIPYWTYDSYTHTRYSGQRGDVYYVTKRYQVVENGRRVTRTREVAKIRWTRVSGHTARHFDDVLVGASRTLPRRITDWLEPWDLDALVPYAEAYLAGFKSEIYQVDLDEGFRLARGIMDGIIRADVRRAIGGDSQRIGELSTRHSGNTFKHILLPVWVAGFRYRERSYRFVVNGRTGKVRGERPYSKIKIVIALMTALLLAALLLLALAAGGAFDTLQY